jgi:glutamine amidotransferase
MKIAIVKYNAGNVYSVVNAMRRLGIEPLLTDDAETLRGADRVLFPGQGEASGAMDYLRQRGLDQVIRSLRQPVLGICIGQQLMCRHSEEGDTDCLGIFDADVKRFQPQRHEDKVPCMGWNALYDLRSPLFEGLDNQIVNRTREALGSSNKSSNRNSPYVYFVHSYYVPVCNETIATTDYILPYSAAMHKDNFYACQFHPEKSGKVGEQILRNFLEIEKTY